jgi:hypothetical protein
VAFAVYLGIALAFWWHAWSTHPTSTTVCGCGDPARFLWFLEWPAYALTHGHAVFYSQWLFHPAGINLLNDTSVLAFGVGLAPVTWLFGPVATLNTAATLIPALSALSMFWLLRRWVAWAPAAFVGGLVYGFSPFVLSGLATGWLTTMLALPPLMIGCFDELCLRNRWKAGWVGTGLGVLCAVQYFLSTEVLAISALLSVIGLVPLAVYATVFHRAELRCRAPRIAIGFATAAGVALALLAYPVWFIFAGPAHLRGLVWPAIQPGYYGTPLSGFFRLTNTAQATTLQRRYGGYQGIALHQTEYLGAVLLIVLITGTLLWLRDRRLWLFLFVGATSVSLCLTPFWPNDYWVPWRILGHLPVVQNILPVRFASMAYLAAAVMLGIIVDHAHGSTLRLVERAGAGAHSPSRGTSRRWSRPIAGLVAVVVAVVALGPMAWYYGTAFPLTMEPVVLPAWFQTVAPHLPAGQVVLTYPSAFGGLQAPMAWQAVNRMSYALVGGDGPASVPQRAGAERPGYTVLADSTFGSVPATAYLPSSVAKVRRALQGWGTTVVVIPDQPELPAYDRGDNTAYAVALMTAALGAAPRYESRAWTWSIPAHPAPSLTVDPAAFRSCVGHVNSPVGDRQAVPDCMVAASAVVPAAP